MTGGSLTEVNVSGASRTGGGDGITLAFAQVVGKLSDPIKNKLNDLGLDSGAILDAIKAHDAQKQNASYSVEVASHQTSIAPDAVGTVKSSQKTREL